MIYRILIPAGIMNCENTILFFIVGNFFMGKGHSTYTIPISTVFGISVFNNLQNIRGKIFYGKFRVQCIITERFKIGAIAFKFKNTVAEPELNSR
jgi:hypothetical protein